MAVLLFSVGLDIAFFHLLLSVAALDRGTSFLELQRLAVAYPSAAGLAIFPARQLARRYGLGRTFALAWAGIATGTVGCLVAESSGGFLSARAVLGLGTGAMIAVSVAAVDTLLPDGERNAGTTLLAAAMAMGIPLGLPLGGWLLTMIRPEQIFLGYLPLLAVGGILAALTLRDTPIDPRSPLDPGAWVVLAVGVTAVVSGAILAGEQGFLSAASLGAAVGVGLLAIMVMRWARRSAEPPRRASFLSPVYLTGTTLGGLATSIMMAMFFLLPQRLHVELKIDTLGVALRLLPMVLGLVVASQLSETWRPLLGLRAVVAGGFVLLAGACAAGAVIGAGTDMAPIAGWTAALGLGLGLTLTPALHAAIHDLAQRDSVSGSSILQSVRQLSASVGIAVLGAVFHQAHHGRYQGAAASAVNGPLAVTPGDSGPADGLSAVLWLTAGISVLGCVIAVAALPGRRTAVGSSRPGEG